MVAEATYHHVEKKCALWVKVLEFANYGKHFMFPDFCKYHCMHQCGYLEEVQQQHALYMLKNLLFTTYL